MAVTRRTVLALGASAMACGAFGCDRYRPPRPRAPSTAVRERAPTPSGPADLIVRGGSIITGDPAKPHAEALAVRHGTIVAVGAHAAIESLRTARTEVVDLAGGAATAPARDGAAS